MIYSEGVFVVKSRGLAFLFLFGFWLVITESLVGDSVVVGLALSWLIVLYNRDIMVRSGEFPAFTVRRARILLKHTAQLLVEIVKANIQVAKIVLSPRLELDQGVVIFTPKLRYSWNKVLLANSITL